MKKTNPLTFFLTISLTFLIFPSAPGQSQETQVKPALLEQPMPEFILPSYQGEEVRLSTLRGKNVMIIFPRGYAGPDRWCTICNYKYVELVELEKTLNIRKKYNVEILFVLPYSKETVRLWLESLPEQMTKIKSWKYPENMEELNERGRQSVERYRKIFPKDFTVSQDNIPVPFPILIDADRKLSSSLGIFATEWGGSRVEQNIPSVYIINKDGLLCFKYIGQNTVDRPSYRYLFRVLEIINEK
jgi:peroxiredoxin